MSWRDITLPARVARRPRDTRGYPILFTAWIRKDGTPDFRVSDEAKRRLCAASRLCGICGELLPYYITFLGGPLAVQNRVFGDPPMHAECADYSARVCPYLTTRAERKATGGTMPPGGVPWKSDRLCLYQTRSFSLLEERTGFVFRAAPAVSLEWRTVPIPGGHP